MASGFSGGGSDFYGGGTPARSISSAPQPPYLSQNQFPGILPESSPSLHPQLSQQQPPARPFVRKRTLVDSQLQQQRQQHRQVQNQALNNLLLHFVKPRIHPKASVVSPFHSLDFPAAVLPSSPDVIHLRDFSSAKGPAKHGFDGVALLQRMRSQPIRNGMVRLGNTVTTALPGVPFLKALQNDAILLENENVMVNRLPELEKELLDEEEEATEGNATSVVTNLNSEWCNTLQSLMVTMSQVQKQISAPNVRRSSGVVHTSVLLLCVCLRVTSASPLLPPWMPPQVNSPPSLPPPPPLLPLPPPMRPPPLSPLPPIPSPSQPWKWLSPVVIIILIIIGITWLVKKYKKVKAEQAAAAADRAAAAADRAAADRAATNNIQLVVVNRED